MISNVQNSLRDHSHQVFNPSQVFQQHSINIHCFKVHY